MDDITSCLTVLSEYISSWAEGVSEHNTSLLDELKLLKVVHTQYLHAGDQ